MKPWRKAQAELTKFLYRATHVFVEMVRRSFWPKGKPARINRICIYRIGNIGDIVCALPAMHAIRKTYPQAHVTFLTSPGQRGMLGAKELLEGADWLDEILVYYTDEVATLQKQWALIRRLRAMAFDIWIELPNDLATLSKTFRNMSMARLAHAQWGYGWRINLIRWAVQAQSEYLSFPNETERLLTLVSEAGMEKTHPTFPLPIQEKHRAAVDQLLEREALTNRPMAAIAPAAKRPLNRWPAERFAEVGGHMLQKGFSVVILGGPSDFSLCQEVAQLIGRGSFNLSGKTSLLESCELLRRCRMLVCNDSGVQHLAGAMGTPCVSIFAFRDLRKKWWPYGEKNIVLQKWVPCHACLREICPYDNLCIKLIESSQVNLLLDKLLGEGVPNVI